MKKIAENIVIAINPILLMLNPAKVIFSGEITNARGFIEYISEKIYKTNLPETVKYMVIEKSVLGDKIGGIGAAVIVMQEEFGFTTKVV